jgi:hypothetical protein
MRRWGQRPENHESIFWWLKVFPKTTADDDFATSAAADHGALEGDGALTDKYGFPIRHRTRRKCFMGFQTGDVVSADIPQGKFAGHHGGRLSAVRQRPSFSLNGFDVNPKYLKRIHQADGFEYRTRIDLDSRANARQKKAFGHSTALP